MLTTETPTYILTVQSHGRTERFTFRTIDVAMLAWLFHTANKNLACFLEVSVGQNMIPVPVA